jgi:5,10-methylenetetrahydromethanopterin reductase
MDLSCAFATSLDTPDHIVLAERLGYRRAWCYDSPALYPDVWMTLARAAERTSRIELGPGVLIPSLRHPMTNAAAIATLAHLAPGRVVVGVGAGFTGRVALGQRPLAWTAVRRYILALQALLRGEPAAWDGATIQMLHRPGFAPPRPLRLPFMVAAGGPKGLAVARELADGVWSMGIPVAGLGFTWVARSISGTVLAAGEDPGSGRVLAAAGHAAAVTLHALYERRGRDGTDRLDALPGGAAWRRRVEALPAAQRHLAVHEGHLVGLNDLDRAAVTGDLLTHLRLATDAEGHRARLDEYAREGITEAVYQPAGPDIPRELTAFAEMARSGSAATLLG